MNLSILDALMNMYFIEEKFGRVLNLRYDHILWETLLLPGLPFRNLIVLL
jgi:hypothetical protein